MKERGMLFSAPMVKALLEGSKTQTRRVVQFPRTRDAFVVVDYGNGWWPYQSDDGESELCDDGNEHPYNCPYGQVGDGLRVRETFWAWGRWETRFSTKKGRDEWHFVDMTSESGMNYLYEQPTSIRVGMKRNSAYPAWWKRNSLFMPRRASRILLEITNIRVERLQDISEAEAKRKRRRKASNTTIQKSTSFIGLVTISEKSEQLNPPWPATECYGNQSTAPNHGTLTLMFG